MRRTKARGNGEGTIFQRKDTLKWVAKLTVGFDADGRQIVLSEQFVTRKDADAWLTKQKSNRDQGLFVNPSKDSLSDYMDHWLDTVASHSLKRSTVGTYRGIIETHIKPEMGKTPLNKLAPQQIQNLYHKRLKAGLSPYTIRQVHNILHKALDHAKRQGILASNATEYVERPKVTPKQMKTLTPEEGKRFLEAAKGDRLYAMYLLALQLGLRMGELLGLRWQDLNFDEGTLTVSQTLQNRSGKMYFDTPKSKASSRVLPLSPAIIEALRKHKVAQNKEKLAFEYSEEWSNPELVFTTVVGSPYNQSNIRSRSFLPLLQKAKCPRIRFHDLRHTAISAMGAMGLSPKEAQELAGHAQVTTTLATYTHVWQKQKKEAMKRIDEFWSKGG